MKFIYAMRCSNRSKLYVGISSNPSKRVEAHNHVDPTCKKGLIKETSAGAPDWKLYFTVGPFVTNTGLSKAFLNEVKQMARLDTVAGCVALAAVCRLAVATDSQELAAEFSKAFSRPATANKIRKTCHSFVSRHLSQIATNIKQTQISRVLDGVSVQGRINVDMSL